VSYDRRYGVPLTAQAQNSAISMSGSPSRRKRKAQKTATSAAAEKQSWIAIAAL